MNEKIYTIYLNSRDCLPENIPCDIRGFKNMALRKAQSKKLTGECGMPLSIGRIQVAGYDGAASERIIWPQKKPTWIKPAIVVLTDRGALREQAMEEITS